MQTKQTKFNNFLKFVLTLNSNLMLAKLFNGESHKCCHHKLMVLHRLSLNKVLRLLRYLETRTVWYYICCGVQATRKT